jgi:hypothetical protein
MRVGWGWFQRAGALALVAGSLGLAGLDARLSPAVVFLDASPAAPWIMAPLPVSAGLEQWGRERPPETRFRRHLELAQLPERVSLRLRAVRDFRLSVNGQVPEGGSAEGGDWRRARSIDVTPLLRPGSNQLDVHVRHRNGPALLSLASEGLAPPLRSDGQWRVAVDGRPLGAAIPADDTRVNPAALAVETPLEGLARRATLLLGLAALGALGAALWPRMRSERLRASLPAASLAAAALLWMGVALAKGLRLPLEIGFDARHHLAYVAFVRERWALPLATDGWSMFHPPLFYGLAALLAPLGELALRALPWIAGLLSLLVVRGLAARLYPGEPCVAVLAVLFAAVVPVHLYSAAYFTNETLHAGLAGLALLASVDALLAPRASPRQLACLGVWFGLAALTKFTALALAPVALFFLTCKGLALERDGARAVARRVGLAAGLMLAVAGAWYARNLWHFGTPILGNWGRMPGAEHAWWQQPGFHTLAWYTGFGESLHHPWLAGFHSFWDGVYSTFWGDGGIGGRVFPADRHGLWSYDFMSAGYLVGLPFTGLLALGLLRWLGEAFRAADPHRRAALSFLLTGCWAVGFSLLYLTLRLPFFAQAKASYALPLLAPLSLAFAVGAAGADDWLARAAGPPARWAFAGLVAAGLACLYLGFAGP